VSVGGRIWRARSNKRAKVVRPKAPDDELQGHFQLGAYLRAGKRDGAFERAIGPEPALSRNGCARLSSPDGPSRPTSGRAVVPVIPREARKPRSAVLR
jgi:hypothetical protein